MNLIFDHRNPWSADEFRAWRERLRLTRYEAGLLLDLSERMIFYYESGQRRLPFAAYVNCVAYENWKLLRAQVPDIIASREQVRQCS